MHWNHTFAKTVGRMCYRVIHDQLTEFPEGYSQYGLQRTGRDGKGHKKPYWAGTPYDESDGLGKWLQQNQNLTYTEKRIKCLNWLLDGEKKIGVIDPQGYYDEHPATRTCDSGIESRSAGQDVANELARVRELSKTRPANQVPKELLPDGPLPEIEEKHALQETSATLKSLPRWAYDSKRHSHPLRYSFPSRPRIRRIGMTRTRPSPRVGMPRRSSSEESSIPQKIPVSRPAA